MLADPIERVRAVLDGHPEVLVGYVFGSVARGEQRSDSDIDIAILLGGRPSPTLSGSPTPVKRELERSLEREVDLVVLDDAAPDLVHRVLRDGVLVCERDRSRRIAFEVKKRNEYLDLLPVLRRYRRAEAT